MKILFSPLGMTDPIRFFKDGAALNVARKYQPDVIYLYMSKEIVQKHKEDNRYVYSFEKLGELLGKDFEIHTIERPDLEDVQLFDSFLTEFRAILEEIHNDHPDAEILLNVSSGSPAMKSSLQILSLTLDFPCTPVQVSSPMAKSNPRVDNESDLSPEDHWELNESNETDDDRCIVSQTTNLLDEFRKQTVIDMVRSYNYTAAYDIAKKSPAFSQKCREMLDAACARLKLNYSKARTIFGKYGVKVITDAPKECLDLYEYLLVIKVKLCNEEYADFLRALTPAIANLYELYLKRKCNIDLEDYTVPDREGKRIWDRRKMSGSDVLGFLDERYGTLKDNSPVYSDALVELIGCYSKEPDATICSAEIRRKVESRLRNQAAHTIVAISADTVKKETGFTPDEIFKKLVQMFNYCGFTFAENCYDKMNDAIIESI